MSAGLDRTRALIDVVEGAQGPIGKVNPATIAAQTLAEAAATLAQQRATAAATARDQAQAAVGYGRFVADTQAQLAGADALARPDGAIAEVIADPGAVTATAGNGTYVKVGAPGAGTFAKRNDQTLPALATAVGLRQLAGPATRALALLAGVTVGLGTFVTQGYATPGDGGGATYVEEAPTYVATALDIVVGGRKFRNASFELRLQMAGSKGDGSAIERATWNAVFALGRPVRIVGEHRLDNDVSLPSGATLIADPGKGILTAGTSGTVLSVNVRSDITISGVWFKGRMDGPALAGMVQFANCKNLRIDGRCRFSDHKYTALSIINGINCAVSRIEVYRCGYHSDVNDVAPAVAFFQSLIGTGLTSATEMELWRFNRQNSFTHNYLEECYGCKVAGQFGFTGDHNTMYGRGLVAPGYGLSHNSHSSFCHNNVSSGKFGGAAIDSLVSYRCKYNDNVFWECAGAGLLIANSTDDEACNNFCHDNWQSYDVDPVQYPGNGPSLHRGGIVIDCDTTKLNPTVARLRLYGNVCRNTKAEATQQNGLQIRNPATMDIASWVIDGSNDFSGNAGADITPPYGYSGLKARSARAYVAPASYGAAATDYDPATAGLREVAEKVAWMMGLLEAQGAVGEVPFPLPGATLDMDFARGQYLGKQPSALSVTRANTATGLLYKDVNAASFTTFAANTLPIVPGRGLAIFPNRTQVFANPAAPATQTVNLAVGTYTGWCLGTGWLSATQGTGVATEIGGTGTIIRPGTPLTITVTTAGSFTFTVNGLLRFMQLEDGPEASAGIPFTGASNGTIVSLAGSAFTDIFGGATVGTLYADIIPQVTPGYGTAQQLFGLSDGTTANRILAFRQSTGEVTFRYTANGANLSLGSVGQVPSGRSCRIALGFGVGTGLYRAIVNGADATFAAPTAFPIGLNVLRFGTNEAGTGQQANATLRRLAFVPATMPDYLAQKYTLA